MLLIVNKRGSYICRNFVVLVVQLFSGAAAHHKLYTNLSSYISSYDAITIAIIIYVNVNRQSRYEVV